MLKSKAYF